MLIKELDFLSPEITLYYKGSKSHSSIISGILSIISISIIFAFSIYFFLNLIQRKNPDSYSLNRFIEDSGVFPINSSSLFHFISLGNIENNIINNGFDFRSFRIIGFDSYYTKYLEDKNLEKYDHWLYGLCNNETDTEGIGYLFKSENFKKCACIRKYYNSLEKKYYNTNDPNFKWPTLSHGNYHPDATYYQILVDRCNEDTLKLVFGENYNCKNDDEINEYFTGVWGINFFIIDHYIDVLNYKEPNRKFLFRIENTLSKEIYSINHLNFNPSSITTHNGILFDHKIEETSHVFDRNDVFTNPIDSNNIYMIYYFWLKNRINSYGRTYQRIQDIISDIGCISEIINILASIINKIYNSYIILFDTEKFLFSIIESQEKSAKKNSNIDSNNEPNNLKEDNQLNFDSTKSVARTFKNLDIKKFNENLKTKDFKKRNTKIRFTNITTTNSSSENIQNIQYFHKRKNMKNKNNDSIKIKDIEDTKNNKTERKYSYSEIREQKLKFNFCNYLCYELSCKKKNNKLNMYDNFRTNIICEEYFLRNYINIYNLLKINENRLSENINKYQLKDILEVM